LFFGAPPVATTAVVEVENPKKEPKAKQVNDPAMVAAARELRDRWLEQVSATPLIGCGKYEVSRVIGEAAAVEGIDDGMSIEPRKLLPAA
jgi:hypothetical protein